MAQEVVSVRLVDLKHEDWALKPAWHLVVLPTQLLRGLCLVRLHCANMIEADRCLCTAACAGVGILGFGERDDLCTG